MLPPAVVEQHAKLGVSAEDSKAQRLKRQQARFRDRGGIFVPSNSNPLVDILLARTVSGESPSKARSQDVSSKRLSPTKAHQPAIGGSRLKPPAPRKRKVKVVEPEIDTATKPAPKRRGRPTKGRKEAPDSDTEQPPDIKSKGKVKQRDTARSTLDRSATTKAKSQAKGKSKSAKEVVELLLSDDQTLVDAPYKANSNFKRDARYKGDSDSDDDAPIVRKRRIHYVDGPKASRSKTTHAKMEKIASAGSSGEKTLENGGERLLEGKYPKTTATAKKRLVIPDDGDDDVAAPSAKKGKAASSTSAKPRNPIEPVPQAAPRTSKENKNPKVTGKVKGKVRVEPDQDMLEAVGELDDQRLPAPVSKPKKRKKEDNCDDRPRKAVKITESAPHSSSQKLKENQSERKSKSSSKPGVKEESDAQRLGPAAKPSSRGKTSKGPPREVLERIKASAARRLQCADSEPDELDCLS